MPKPRNGSKRIRTRVLSIENPSFYNRYATVPHISELQSGIELDPFGSGGNSQWFPVAKNIIVRMRYAGRVSDGQKEDNGDDLFTGKEVY